jgi:transglutaminase-like putative cysteine protease
MLFNIQHRTELAYSERISESVVEVRLTPRSDAHQTLRHFHIEVKPDARVSNHVDWHGNPVNQFSVVAFHDRVVILSTAVVETHPASVDPLRASDAIQRTSPSHRLMDFLRFHGPVQRDARILEIGERLKLYDEPRVVDVVRLVSNGVRETLTYKKGVTNASTTVVEALDCGAGVCQDFAHLALSLLRLVGVPSRYVSGYLYRPDMPEVESHAWIEAFVPSVGWVGFDPTHGEAVGEQHVAVATGRSYADVPPNRGVYRGEADESISASVSIHPVDAPIGIGPFGMPFHVPSYSDSPVTRFSVSSARLEQQQQQQQDRKKAQVQQQRQQQQ